ncbi:MAG: hypothetical protein ABW224_18265, partial [Kibdelosporangium sp.]
SKMSHSQDPSTPEPAAAGSSPDRADEIIRRIGAHLLGGVPDGWRRLDYQVTMATMVEDHKLTAIMGDGAALTGNPPMELKPDLAELRKEMYQPGRGTWFSMRLVLDPPDAYTVHFNFDLDPGWEPPVPPEVFRRDLQAFPRDDAHVPDWLRAQLAAGPDATEGTPA